MLTHRLVMMTICCAAVTFVTSCQGGGGDARPAAVNSASVLTADQFAVSPTRTLSSADFTSRLNENSDFMGDGQSTSSSDACIASKIIANKFTRNNNNTFTLSVNDTDIKECFQNASITVVEATVSTFVNNALATDDAGNALDLTNVSLDAPGVNMVQLSQKTRFHLNISGIQTGRTTDLVEIQVTHAGTGFNDPCTNEGVDQCRWEVLDQHHQNFTPTDYIDKDVLESHGLGVVNGAPYYAGGTMTFSFNNWSGTMTYNSSAFTAPTYTATDGVNTVSGTYTNFAPPFKAKGLSDGIVSSARAMFRKAALSGGLR